MFYMHKNKDTTCIVVIDINKEKTKYGGQTETSGHCGGEENNGIPSGMECKLNQKGPRKNCE